MDAYPLELITHEAPLLLISGLGGRGRWTEMPPYPLLNTGPHAVSHLPSLTDEPAERLLDFFQKYDATGLWGKRPERGAKASQRPVFRIRIVGREYRLPPRKANPPSPGIGPSPIDGSPTRILHSPISPLSPDSPLFPDGAFSHIWLRKHQSLLPAVFVSFFALNTQMKDPAFQALEDGKIVEAINSAKKPFQTSNNGLTSTSTIGGEELRSSGSRTRFVAVILSERSIMTSAQIDDRLSTIRRGTSLTTNVTFYAAQTNASPVELEQFVLTFLASLYPGAVEYYRELSKHARRKRNKGSIPHPTIPTSRALSSQGWNLRYEFKLGIFAEFRQEMDVAGRNYETAYEKLLTEVFEATSSWSERWLEARMLSDILILRIVRCYLWLENYVFAKQRWSYHVARMRDILDRKGKGTGTYGFAAWLSRWNKCLADLIHIANLPVFAVNTPPVGAPRMIDIVPPTIYYKADKVGERLTSQEFLHHPGFYYMAAAEWITVRERRAKRINLEDEGSYDTYLCPSPKEEREVDHIALQIPLLVLARTEFDLRQQKRMVESVSYQIANLRMLRASESPKFWAETLKDLRSIAIRYRKEGWWGLLEEVLWRIIECGQKGGDAGSIVLAEFELMCRSIFQKKSGRRYDLSRCLEDLDTSNVKPTIVARASDVVNILSVSYSFEFPTVHAGQAVNSQLCISSNAHPSSAPLVFSELKITYEGGLKTVLLRHDPSKSQAPSQSAQMIDLRSSLHELTSGVDGQALSPTSLISHTFLTAETDLSIAPGETKIYELSAVLRETGTAKGICGTFGMINDSFDFDFVVMFGEDDSAVAVHPLPIWNPWATRNGGARAWWIKTASGEVRKRPLRAHPGALTILPRPPKMEVSAKGLENGIYTDEIVKIGLEVVNGEGEDAEVGVDVKILGWPMEEEPQVTWLADGGSDLPLVASLHPLGNMKPSERVTWYFKFPPATVPADCTLEIKLRYNLVSDPETPIEKIVSAEMPIITPFHCTFDFSPRVHPDAWPDYFSLDDELFEKENGKMPRPQGIIQRWCLSTSILGVGKDNITLEGWELLLQQVAGAVECKVSSTEQKPLILEPSKTLKFPFMLNVLKHSLEDRSPSTIDTTLLLRWRRLNGNTTTTILSVPRLYIPLREPRVLCESTIASPEVMKLTYSIENPTNYFLTFGLLMETNEEFAFSGPKQTSLQLLPVSKTTVEYRVFPYVRGVWIKPSLKVLDRYFNKTLKAAPGGDGVAVDKVGLMVWVPEVLEASEDEVEEEGSDDEDDEDDSDYVDECEETDSEEYEEDSEEEEEEEARREDEEAAPAEKE